MESLLGQPPGKKKLRRSPSKSSESWKSKSPFEILVAELLESIHSTSSKSLQL